MSFRRFSRSIAGRTVLVVAFVSTSLMLAGGGSSGPVASASTAAATTTATPVSAAAFDASAPSPLPNVPAGTLIKYQQGLWYTNWFLTAQVNGKVWNLMFMSTNADGSPVAVTATLIVPNSFWLGSRPLVAYAPGTQGWANSCAPSQEMAAGHFDEGFAVTNLLNYGYAVVVDDYPGLGTTNTHEYNVGIPEGHSVLDMLRAAETVPGAGLSAGTPVAIEGYSQGGGAGGWAAQLQPTYAPQLNLKGVAIGGTPANLQDVANNINGTDFFAFLAGTAMGFNFAYPKDGLLSSLTPAGVSAMSALNEMCQGTALTTYAGGSIQDYTVGNVNPMTDPAWTAVLDQNNLGTMKPGVPIYQYYGLFDEVIPAAAEDGLDTDWCAMGVKDDFVGYLGEHVLTQLEAQTDVDNWIQARFEGLAAPSNCS